MMGMYDSIYTKLTCPDCEVEDWQEIQTKRFGCALMRYFVGDVVPEAPAGELWLKEEWLCDHCVRSVEGKREKTKLQPVFVRLVNGFILGVAQEPVFDKPVEPAQLIEALQVAAKRGTGYRLELSSLYHFIGNVRFSLREVEREPMPHRKHLPKSETELLDRIEESLEKVLLEPDKREL